MATPDRLTIRPIRTGDDLKKLSLGDGSLVPLKTFLKRDALQYEEQSVARTYVLVDAEHLEQDSRVWGYVTLVASEVATTHQNAPAVARWPDGYTLPGIKIARMAVDKELQGEGMGRALLSYAAGLAKERVCSAIGCKLLITDAKANAVPFYEKSGFTMLDTDENRRKDTPVMFIDISRL